MCVCFGFRYTTLRGTFETALQLFIYPTCSACFVLNGVSVVYAIGQGYERDSLLYDALLKSWPGPHLHSEERSNLRHTLWHRQG